MVGKDRAGTHLGAPDPVGHSQGLALPISILHLGMWEQGLLQAVSPAEGLQWPSPPVKAGEILVLCAGREHLAEHLQNHGIS